MACQAMGAGQQRHSVFVLTGLWEPCAALAHHTQRLALFHRVQVSTWNHACATVTGIVCAGQRPQHNNYSKQFIIVAARTASRERPYIPSAARSL